MREVLGNPGIEGSSSELQLKCLLDKLENVGWEYEGETEPETGRLSIVFKAPVELRVGPVDLAQQLDTLSEDGVGFMAGRFDDPESDNPDGCLIVRYNGLFTDKVVAVFTGMTALAGLRAAEA
jgi:hypothetical protein